MLQISDNLENGHKLNENVYLWENINFFLQEKDPIIHIKKKQSMYSQKQ